jgi:hypothetical protein
MESGSRRAGSSRSGWGSPRRDGEDYQRQHSTPGGEVVPVAIAIGKMHRIFGGQNVEFVHS